MKKWYNLLYQFDDLSPLVQNKVYRSFYKFVYKDIFYLKKDHALTEDMIQEAFFKVISAVQKHEVYRMLPWIRQVARNITLDYMKKLHKQRHVTATNEVNMIEHKLDSEKRSLGIDNEIENKIRDEVLHQVIAELKPDYRLIIKMFYIEELSSKEIAATLHISEQAVSQKLVRARKKLLEQFKRKWDER